MANQGADPGEFLFWKMLTRTDISGGNGILIFKHDAFHFPDLEEEDVPQDLAVTDESGRVWLFGYIFTHNKYFLRLNWHRFVKEHSLQFGDKVRFYRDDNGDIHIRFERVDPQLDPQNAVRPAP